EAIAGEIGGLTRERVRQIINQINEKIRKKFRTLLVFSDYFDERTKFINKKLKYIDKTITTLAREFKIQLSESTLLATEEDIERFIAIIRLLVISDKPWARENFGVTRKDLAFLVCLAEPSIEKYTKVRKFFEKEK